MIRLLYLRWRRNAWLRHETTLREHMAGYSAALASAALQRRRVEAELAMAEMEQRSRAMAR